MTTNLLRDIFVTYSTLLAMACQDRLFILISFTRWTTMKSKLERFKHKQINKEHYNQRRITVKLFLPSMSEILRIPLFSQTESGKDCPCVKNTTYLTHEELHCRQLSYPNRTLLGTISKKKDFKNNIYHTETHGTQLTPQCLKRTG